MGYDINPSTPARVGKRGTIQPMDSKNTRGKLYKQYHYCLQKYPIIYTRIKYSLGTKAISQEIGGNYPKILFYKNSSN